MYIMNHETISYKTLIQELSVQYNCLTLSYKNSTNTCANSLCPNNLPPLHNPCNWNSHNEFELPSLHMLMSISTACVNKSQLISKLSLSPVISIGVHWNDMHVVNRGKSFVKNQTSI